MVVKDESIDKKKEVRAQRNDSYNNKVDDEYTLDKELF
jgi:hypothetical protein